MPVVVPTGVVHNWVKTSALKVHTFLQRRARFSADVAKPFRAQLVFNSSFSNKERALISSIQFFNYFPKRPIAGGFRFNKAAKAGAEKPLIAQVIVAANYVEVLWSTAELRLHAAGQHVPGLVLGQAITLSLARVLEIVRIQRQHIDHRIDLRDARPIVDVPQSFTGRNVRAHQLLLQLVAAVATERI